jgi:hypothetical protein
VGAEWATTPTPWLTFEDMYCRIAYKLCVCVIKTIANKSPSVGCATTAINPWQTAFEPNMNHANGSSLWQSARKFSLLTI